MSDDSSWIGMTAGRGAFVVDARIAGSSNARLLGHERATGRKVHFGVIPDASVPLAEIVQRLSYEVEGVAPARFIGGFDRSRIKNSCVLVIEEVGEGAPLSACSPRLTPEMRLQISRQITKTVARAKQQGVVLAGIQPDLICVDEGAASSATLFPRYYPLLAVKQKRKYVGMPDWPFQGIGPFIDPAMMNPWNATLSGDVYCVGLLLGWLFTGKHPFLDVAHRLGWSTPMEEDQRDPFTGPPAIGAILDRVLLADPAKRMPIDDVVAALEAIR